MKNEVSNKKQGESKRHADPEACRERCRAVGTQPDEAVVVVVVVAVAASQSETAIDIEHKPSQHPVVTQHPHQSHPVNIKPPFVGMIVMVGRITHLRLDVKTAHLVVGVVFVGEDELIRHAVPSGLLSFSLSKPQPMTPKVNSML